MSIKNIISLAALFHDIGKFYQRCGIKEINDYNYEYCPKYNNHLSHLHVAFTAQFFDDFENIIQQNIRVLDDDLNVLNIAARHHDPSNEYEWIIAAADRLASGLERNEFDKYNSLTEDEVKQQYNYKKSRLLSIFSKVKLTNKNIPELFYSLEKLNPGIIPHNLENKSIKEAEKEYQLLFQEFIDDFNKLTKVKYNNFNNFYNAISTILEKYLWCIPSSSYHIQANVSLFDHLKTTAAIATALYSFHKTYDRLNSKDISEYDSDEEKFILIQGDFSGIQDFIFSKFGESNKFAAKILRAKSFFVSICTEMAANLILQKFNLNYASIIMNAGGKFTILAPNLQGSPALITDVKKDINDFFIDLTFGETKFNMAFTKLSGNDFLKGNISYKFQELANNLAIDKLSYIPPKMIFADYIEKVNKTGGVCRVDGRTPRKEGSEYSEASEMFKKMGTFLPKVEYLLVSTNPEKRLEYSLFSNISFSLREKPASADLVFKINKFENFSGYGERMIAYYVPIMEEVDLHSEKYLNMPEYRFDKTPMEVGEPKTFTHIAYDSLREVDIGKFEGKPFIGVLKADIDNLGQIFAEGFGNKVSFADIVSLSRMLDYFFVGWLPNIIRKKFPSVYTVFAGGDDLFLIGPYNHIVALAKEISVHLKDYVAKNPDIHISAGINICKPQIPVYQMAEKAEALLEKSKENIGKNSVTIFDITVKWDEFLQLLKFKEQLEKYIEIEDRFSTAYIYKILKFIEMASKIKKAKKITLSDVHNALWISLLSYHTYRTFDNSDNKEEILKIFYENIVKYYEKLVIPISLLIYERRK
ncbi:type III-A CRISPR-associated protein Cas10/Csm1 [Deferribacter abyssi]|uniref:type III-A CRISPR-associated protein Cas10/Csm1 n=1 Tax=Deferribacter abyssi TaxID=213806 RepID=UPI003C13CD76